LTHHAAEPAVEVFTKGNRLFPHSVRMLAGLGASLYALGSFDQAAQRLCEASDLIQTIPSLPVMGKMQAVETTQSEAIEQRLARFGKTSTSECLGQLFITPLAFRNGGSLPKTSKILVEQHLCCRRQFILIQSSASPTWN